jgi:hypothetical protein
LGDLVYKSTIFQIVTLLKEIRQLGSVRSDRQLHVLPNYRAANVDESGSREAQTRKIQSGALEIIQE